jgi:pimeloyl-ACP methyl ester carboxylesterase
MTLSRNLEFVQDAGGLTPERAGGTVRGVGDSWYRRAVEPIWVNRRRAWGTTLVVAASYGVFAGWWTPRGPLTTFEALATMALSLTVGFVAGLVLRSRWAMLVVPVAFVVMCELTRLGFSGPTVDGIRLDSTYAIMALAVGRGVHGVLALLPMVLGAAVGAALARHWLAASPRRRGVAAQVGSWLRRSVAVVTGLVLVVVAAFVARPATTDPIVDADGRTVAGSVAELTAVEINGHRLALMIRGRSTKNPVLLFLAGGPGGSEFGAMRNHSEALEDDFVVVTLDQRGTGKSYDQLDPASTLTLDGAVGDVLDVTEYLRDRFRQDKVYLVAQSWGTILGVLAVQREPQLYRAFVGTGQMVSPLATDKVYYRDTLAWARDNGDTDLVDTLTRIGPPPYTQVRDYEPTLSHEYEVYPYDHTGNSEGSGGMTENIFVEEYSLLDTVHVLAGFLDAFPVLYPQIQDIDFRTQATRLDVPVYLAQGRHETPGRAGPAQEWFDLLQAPHKEMVVLDNSGHRPLWEQPQEFAELMTGTVLPQTTS